VHPRRAGLSERVIAVRRAGLSLPHQQRPRLL